MAITLVGTASANRATDGALTVTLPVGTTTNDVVYFAYEFGDNSDFNMSMSTTGYTEIADLFGDDDFKCNLAVFRKVMGGTPDTEAVSNAHGGNAGSSIAAVVMVLRGVDTTTPEDAAATTLAAANTNIPDPPSITTVTNGAWVLAVGSSTNAEVATAPTGYSDVVTAVATGAWDNCGIAMALKEIAVAGAENPGAFGNITDSSGRAACSVTIAVRPAAAAGGGNAKNMLLLGVG